MGELLAVTGQYGLTGLAGSSPDPSVVGFSVSGGLSWFGRAHGLAAHGIRAFEVVDPRGVLRRVTADSDPELFWALRGGGGDFAIVTAMEIDLHPAPHVYGGRLLWPIGMARPVLRAFAEITRTAPDELTLWAHLLQFPPIPQVPEPLRGGSFVSIDLAYLGSAEDAERHLMPLRTVPAMWMDTTGTVPLADLGSIAAEPVDPMPASEMSGLLRDFDNAAIDRLLAAAGEGSGSPLIVVQVRHLGGALARATESDGPAGAVAEPYQLFGLGLPMSPEMAAGIEMTFAAVNEAMTGYFTGRAFFTFRGSDDDPTRAFSPAVLDRLGHTKRSVDPNGVVRSNRPVLR